MLKPYAAQPGETRGRLFPERLSTFRSPFQRDRDRIIHSSAFRRLKHKTQVFVEHEGDYYRTRLTHSIEVAQVARTLAGALGLNEGLAEAIALATRLANGPAQSMAGIKGLLVAAEDQPLGAHLEAEALSMNRARKGVEGAEGLASFLEKRKPDWSTTRD